MAFKGADGGAPLARVSMAGYSHPLAQKLGRAFRRPRQVRHELSGDGKDSMVGRSTGKEEQTAGGPVSCQCLNFPTHLLHGQTGGKTLKPALRSSALIVHHIHHQARPGLFSITSGRRDRRTPILKDTLCKVNNRVLGRNLPYGLGELATRFDILVERLIVLIVKLEDKHVRHPVLSLMIDACQPRSHSSSMNAAASQSLSPGDPRGCCRFHP